MSNARAPIAEHTDGKGKAECVGVRPTIDTIVVAIKSKYLGPVEPILTSGAQSHDWRKLEQDTGMLARWLAREGEVVGYFK